MVDSKGNKVTYISETGQELPEKMYADPWKCQKAIDIMDKHRKEAEQEIDELSKKEKKS